MDDIDIKLGQELYAQSRVGDQIPAARWLLDNAPGLLEAAAEKQSGMTPDSRAETLAHIQTVRDGIGYAIEELVERSRIHDLTKMGHLEKSIFDEFTPKLKGTTYGSEEYKEYLKSMQVALDHHYASHRHHPEHFREGIRGMNLVDLLEMMIDWNAATKRHDDGDILRSVEINQDRFGYSDELKQILLNTAHWMQHREQKAERDPKVQSVQFCDCESKHLISDENGTEKCIRCGRFDRDPGLK